MMISNNCDLPKHLYGFVREAFIRSQGSPSIMIPCVIFGIESVPGRALSFHVLLDNGALFSQLPIHALCHRNNAPFRDLSDLLRWDCFGWLVTTIEFQYLREVDFMVKSKSGQIDQGTYICSVDFMDSGYSEDPQQHNIFHLIALEDGNYCLTTNDKCQVLETSFVEKPFDWNDPPKIERNKLTWHAEGE